MDFFVKGEMKDDREVDMMEKESMGKSLDVDAPDLDILSDDVSAAILKHIVDTGGCSKEDLMNIDAVVEEARFLMRELQELGLIDVEGDTVKVTEKGRKVLEQLQGPKETLGG